eukprot:11210002-Lingulodinium_polyedra.AAC.1
MESNSLLSSEALRSPESAVQGRRGLTPAHRPCPSCSSVPAHVPRELFASPSSLQRPLPPSP